MLSTLKIKVGALRRFDDSNKFSFKLLPLKFLAPFAKKEIPLTDTIASAARGKILKIVWTFGHHT